MNAFNGYLSGMRKLSAEEMGRPNAETLSGLPRQPLVVVLDQVRSALNVGSIFRSADAFRVGHAHLCGITAKPPHPEIQKTALGATESVPWTYWARTSDCLRALKEQGFAIAALEQTDLSIDLTGFSPPEGGLALVIGHEVKGVSDEALALCDLALEIPQSGMKHSLNAAVAAGIALFALTMQR